MDEKKDGAGCGLKCCCCTCKAIRAALLLALGGAIGFFAGRCAGKHGMCPMESESSMQRAK